MKRASKAEEALQRQLKRLNAQLEQELFVRNQQEMKIETLREVMEGLEVEITALRAARERASEQQKKGA